MADFVPRDFDVPPRLETPQFVLEPLGPEHNDEDYDAWTSSREHIHATDRRTLAQMEPGTAIAPAPASTSDA